MSGPSAGIYDPVKAIFYTPVRGTDTTTGEPTTGTTAEYCRRHIRFLQKPTMDANREPSRQMQAQSRDMAVFRCRRDSKTELIQADMKMDHRGQMWEIVGVDKIDYIQDEIQVLCMSINTPVTQVVA